jgi:UDP-N-acetylmuramoyl-tripeptide--D-alanyl-D-alanine ligase
VLATRPVGVPAIVVDDVTAALGALARHVAARLGATLVALTGSAGKTSTKDLIAQLLSAHGPTVWTPESFNNEIGLPLTALGAREDTRYLVLEMGARGIGHIRYLTTLTPPRIGVVLNVGTAHIGEFGSKEAIATAKGELVEALPPAADGGVAVLNAADPRVRAMAARTAARPLYFGESEDADVRAEDIGLTPDGRPAFRLRTPTGCAPVMLRLYGEHHVSNALAAAAVAHEVGMSAEAIAETLSTAGPLSKWRMEVTERADGVTIVNDAYNANPDSVRAAPGRCTAGWPSSVTIRSPSTTRSGGSPSGSTSAGSCPSATGRPPGWTWAPRTRVRGVRSRCTCPTLGRRWSCCAESCGREMWCW